MVIYSLSITPPVFYLNHLRVSLTVSRITLPLYSPLPFFLPHIVYSLGPFRHTQTPFALTCLHLITIYSFHIAP